MPIPISTGLQTEFNKQVVDVAYLMQWNMSQILRWSNGGDQTYLAVPWAQVDFELQGLTFDAQRDPTAHLVVGNLDNAIGALFIPEKIADVTVDIYQFSPNALADGDALKMIQMVVGGNLKIGVDKLEVDLIAYSSRYSYSPRMSVDPSHGFNFALPTGTKITWGNQTFVVKEENVN